MACNDPCSVGAHGLSALNKADICATYGARVVSESLARDCGHVQLADALAACEFGASFPPQCYLHEQAGETFAAVTLIVAVLYLLPLFVVCQRHRVD